MYHSLKPLAGVALALGLSMPAAAQDEVGIDTVLATVNGVEITVGHLAIARAALPEQYKRLPADVLYGGLLDQLINQTLLMQSLDEVPRRVEMLLENNRRQAMANEALELLIAGAATETAIREAYDAEFADFQPETEFNASHILVETEEAAADILARAQAGEDFAGLARELSTGPSGPNGGQLGWFGPGQMVPPFEAAVVSMEPGTVAGPVQTQFGWHVIRLNDTRNTSAPSIDEVRADLIANIEREAAEAAVAGLYTGAAVEKVQDVDPEVIMDPYIFDN